MKRTNILNMIGKIIILEAGLLLLPLLVSLIYGESIPANAFLITIVIAGLFGGVLVACFRTKDATIYAKEGFVIVALAWILLSAIGAIPFVISGEIPKYVDAFFETVSGLTTTGASIVPNVEVMSHGILFWRSFTHWIGGMGILVLIMAILPTDSGRAIHIMRAEVPGPTVEKLVPRIKSTAKILYALYLALTVLETILLLCGGMPLFDSVVHAFGTAGTGGFGIKSTSIGGYSPYLQWVITTFMFLFGVNFNLYYMILLKKFKSAIRSEELWVYISIVVVSTLIITANIYSLYSSFSEAIRYSSFQILAIVSTTGYATADFNLWPPLSRALLLILMFCGGCAGSTAGGLKISRIMLLFKTGKRNLDHMLHPHSVKPVRLEGKKVDDETINNTSSYFIIYAICLLAICVCLAFEPFDIETNLSAAISCFNNVGPGLSLVGPTGNYAAYSGFAKIVLSVAMLLGRLEIYPIILALMPTTWMKGSLVNKLNKRV